MRSLTPLVSTLAHEIVATESGLRLAHATTHSAA